LKVRGWLGLQICNLKIGEPNPLRTNTSGESHPSVACQLHNPAEIDPDLARLLAAWPTLPVPIRRAILALVDGAGPPVTGCKTRNALGR
jgi:hypothetical protein